MAALLLREGMRVEALQTHAPLNRVQALSKR